MSQELSRVSTFSQQVFSARGGVLFVLFFALYVAIYGLMSLRLGRGVEEACVMSFPASDDVAIANGRWGIWLWGILIGRGAYPLAAGVAAGVFICCALIVQTWILGLRKGWQQVAYGVIYLSCIQWLFHLRYSQMSAAVAFSFFAGTLGVATMQCSGWRMRIAALLGIAGALSSYQTNVAYCAVLWLSVLLKPLVSGEKLPDRNVLFQQMLLFVGGVVLWFCVSEALKLSPFVRPECLASTRQYQSEMVCWWRLEGESPLSVVRTIGHYAVMRPLWNILGQHYSGQWIYTTALFPALALVLSLLMKRRGKNAVMAGALMALMLWLPFMQYGLFLWDAPARMSVAEPVALACIWGLFLSTREPEPWGRALLTVWLVFISLKGMYHATAWARDEAYYYERCVEELQDMRNRGIQEAARAGLMDGRILLLGGCPGSTSEHLYLWEDVGPCMDRPIPFVVNWEPCFRLYKPWLRLYGMYFGTEEDMEKHHGVFQDMPGWPARGSVRADKGDVIIRLTPRPEAEDSVPAS